MIASQRVAESGSPHAFDLGSTLNRIHGTDKPGTIGQAVFSGCFRMRNDVMEAFGGGLTAVSGAH